MHALHIKSLLQPFFHGLPKLNTHFNDISSVLLTTRLPSHVSHYRRPPQCYWCLALDSAAARWRSAMSMATTFWHAAYSWSRLIATLTTATGKHSIQITVNTPNDSGPSGTATQPLLHQVIWLFNNQWNLISMAYLCR